ncbi:MAG: carbon monoxide dehydrogenase [Pseudobutyrivibrio sp.]|nr:carbon monoxide dehydrogenase [Pseudobutyrivibrio sp.]
MKIYDETISAELKLLEGFQPDKVVTDFGEADSWPDGGNNDMIFGSDMAYELGAGSLHAISEQLMTHDEGFFAKSSVELFGSDLDEIKADRSYAKLVLLKLKDDSFLKDEDIYDKIRAIQYTKYHIHPKGYMARVSASSLREQVRVSKQAIKDGISFLHVGAQIVKAYEKYPQVERVKVIFITRADFDFTKLKELSLASEQITSALDHVLKDVTMNCSSCNIKEICDEVEGMKELHFSTARV